ncbi:MAG TPA: glycosyltransferase family 4 protein [Tepidisphaeraceae bacterium]|jgi:UDP-glucose:(heptosyl)LPS alpha-1,3-glucosyltransferase|nr:glycosyltransferase family 4 protein [Tepidisphaeraceae bacterium]
MNIALVILNADPARGGAERYTADLAAALLARGHAASLLARDFADGLPPATRVPLGGGKGGTRVGRYVRFCDDLDRHLGNTRYDIVHAMLPVRRCDIYHPHAGIAAEAVAEGHLKHEGSVMRVVSQTANRLNRRRQRFASVERDLLAGRRPPVVVCLSRYVERSLDRHYQLPADRRRVLLNSVDLKRFDPSGDRQAADALRQQLGVGPGKVAALMIAQDFARKGLHQAIAAVATIKDPRLVFVAVGKQDPSAYRRSAAALGCDDRVVFPGPCADPRPFYQMADFFVLPTRHDPCSLVVLEALAMGVPVISTAANGACEAMTRGTHGTVLADSADVTGLASAMRNLLDESLRRQMADACLALRPSLSYEHHVDRLLEIYAEAAARPAGGA